MRAAFIQTLTELAAHDDRIILMTADLGFTVLEDFARRFPARFYNVGVAEQNMAGMATGLAEAGFIPFIYSIGTFASLRTYEFIRNGAVMHGLPVRIVGVGGGLEYSSAGFTHNSIDDIAVMRVQPNLRVIAPADPDQTCTAIKETWNLPEPIYYRIGKNDRLYVTGLNGEFHLSQPVLIGAGGDVLIFSTGAITAEVVKLAESLQTEGIHATVAVLASLNPAPNLRLLLQQFAKVVTVEDHYVNGGIGSLVAEAIAESGTGNHLIRCGIRTAPDGITGNLAFLRQHYGIAPEQLAQTIRDFVQA